MTSPIMAQTTVTDPCWSLAFNAGRIQRHAPQHLRPCLPVTSRLDYKSTPWHGTPPDSFLHSALHHQEEAAHSGYPPTTIINRLLPTTRGVQTFSLQCMQPASTQVPESSPCRPHPCLGHCRVVMPPFLYPKPNSLKTNSCPDRDPHRKFTPLPY